MATKTDAIKLADADVFYPQEPKDAYFVESGTVLVYIVPWQNEKPGRRLLLCEVQEKRMIPAFVFRDSDFMQWRFALLAKDTALLSVKSGSVTSVLHRNFVKRAGIKNYEQEGFEASLVEFYKREILKDNAYISKGQNAEPAARAASYGTIQQAFSEGDGQFSGGNDAYKAMAFVCKRLGISLIDSDEIASRCGKQADVPSIAHASRILCRKVVLEPQWQESDCGAIIGTIDGKTVACVPSKRGNYQIYYTEDQKTAKLSAKEAKSISPQAYVIGRTLPTKSLSKKDIVDFCAKSIRGYDIWTIGILGLLCALIGILLPTLNQMIYDDYIPLGNTGQLSQLCAVIATFMIGNLFFAIVKNLSGFRITSRIGYDLQNAVYDRLFHLPEGFFRNYDSADLAKRVLSIRNTITQFANTLIITSLSTLFSLIYLFRMWKYSGKLTWIALLMYFAYGAVIAWFSSRTIKQEFRIAEDDGEASARLYQYLNGVDKIRMAGVEDRAAFSYLQPFAQKQTEEIKKNRVLSVSETISSVISSVFSMVLYLVIVKSNLQLSVGSFIAFNTAFGVFTSAVQTLLQELLNLYRLKSTIQRFWPILECTPEDDETKEIPNKLSGAIRLEHVSFAYQEGGKNVLNDLSLSIRPGEYVGVVGSSGCGKSTLLKLLLGFETPSTGIVLYDGKDLKSLDKGAFRKQLGVVLQNGKLIAGSIYENITITAPSATMADVNAAINAVGLREDIDQMPMGIHTMLNETSNTISGGQQQRILIARAIIGHPSILLFDEATSALDNITQAAVCSNLDKMNTTRIVIAHRLSTVKNCDRIIVLDGGTIAEEGNYQSLMEQKGLFYRLSSRQIAE